MVAKKQVWASGKLKAVPSPGAPKRAKRRRRPVKPSMITMVWGIAALALACSLLVVQGLLQGVFLALSVALTAISAAIDARDPAPVPTPRPVRPVSVTPRSTGTVSAPAKPSGTAPRKTRKQVCNSRCKTSTKPTSTCNCMCGGKTHGVAKTP